jgi:hypothetical protein
MESNEGGEANNEGTERRDQGFRVRHFEDAGGNIVEYHWTELDMELGMGGGALGGQ